MDWFKKRRRILSAFRLKIANELKIDRAGMYRRAMHDRMHDRFPGVVWALGWPRLPAYIVII